MMSQLVLAKCNQIIKLFLEIPMLKIFMTLAILAKRVKDGQLPEAALFVSMDDKEKSLRKALVHETLKSVEDWKASLEKDHKGRPTYFLMVYRAVFEPDQIVLAENAKTLPEFFVPTESDKVIQEFNGFLEQYEGLLRRFESNQTPVAKHSLEAAISPVLSRGTALQRSLKDIKSRPR